MPHPFLSVTYLIIGFLNQFHIPHCLSTWAACLLSGFITVSCSCCWSAHLAASVVVVVPLETAGFLFRVAEKRWLKCSILFQTILMRKSWKRSSKVTFSMWSCGFPFFFLFSFFGGCCCCLFQENCDVLPKMTIEDCKTCVRGFILLQIVLQWHCFVFHQIKIVEQWGLSCHH